MVWVSSGIFDQKMKNVQWHSGNGVILLVIFTRGSPALKQTCSHFQYSGGSLTCNELGDPYTMIYIYTYILCYTVCTKDLPFTVGSTPEFFPYAIYIDKTLQPVVQRGRSHGLNSLGHASDWNAAFVIPGWRMIASGRQQTGPVGRCAESKRCGKPKTWYMWVAVTTFCSTNKRTLSVLSWTLLFCNVVSSPHTDMQCWGYRLWEDLVGLQGFVHQPTPVIACLDRGTCGFLKNHATSQQGDWLSWLTLK